MPIKDFQPESQLGYALKLMNNSSAHLAQIPMLAEVYYIFRSNKKE